MTASDAENQLPQQAIARSSGQQVVLSGESRALMSEIVSIIRAEQREAMRHLELELRAITNDNSILRQNLALMNTALGDFQRLQVIPLREAVEALRQEQGSTVIENQRKLEGLIQALSNTLSAAGGLIPHDLKAQIKDGRFENLPHVREGDLVHVDQVQAMIEEAYARGRQDHSREI